MLIVYAIIVETNIVTLFAAALIPGILAVLFFIMTVAIYVRVVPGAGPPGEAVTREEMIASLIGVIPVVVVFGVVIGGIYAGIYNPTAAAAIGVFMVGVYGIGRRQAHLVALHRRAARDRAHQRHDLSDPARGGAPEDLHGARRRAAGGGGLAAAAAACRRWRSWC